MNLSKPMWLANQIARRETLRWAQVLLSYLKPIKQRIRTSSAFTTDLWRYWEQSQLDYGVLENLFTNAIDGIKISVNSTLAENVKPDIRTTTGSETGRFLASHDVVENASIVNSGKPNQNDYPILSNGFVENSLKDIPRNGTRKLSQSDKI